MIMLCDQARDLPNRKVLGNLRLSLMATRMHMLTANALLRSSGSPFT